MRGLNAGFNQFSHRWHLQYAQAERLCNAERADRRQADRQEKSRDLINVSVFGSKRLTVGPPGHFFNWVISVHF
ncbi:hypothetical protein [Synechococcus sp. M16CYN]|uniref:hypothetical protein n=1 Tax=Synechococcus sp. M16CYN TaxID=3103139 RepID=UPI0033413030